MIRYKKADEYEVSKASARVSNKAVKLDGSEPQTEGGRVAGERGTARLALTAKQVGVTHQPIERKRQLGKLQGPFTNSVSSRYNSCFSIYTSERWTFFKNLSS